MYVIFYRLIKCFDFNKKKLTKNTKTKVSFFKEGFNTLLKIEILPKRRKISIAIQKIKEQ